VRTAQVKTVAHRKAMIEKRDRLIWSMHGEGRTQEAIGAALEVPRTTVSHVIERFDQKRSTAKLVSPERPAPPKVDWPEAKDQTDGASTIPTAPVPKPPSAAEPPAYKIDMGSFLPLLDRIRPIDEGGDDMESGAVGALPDVSDDADEYAVSHTLVNGIRSPTILKSLQDGEPLAPPSKRQNRPSSPPRRPPTQLPERTTCHRKRRGQPTWHWGPGP
jgi:hypothetical protein